VLPGYPKSIRTSSFVLPRKVVDLHVEVRKEAARNPRRATRRTKGKEAGLKGDSEGGGGDVVVVGVDGAGEMLPSPWRCARKGRQVKNLGSSLTVGRGCLLPLLRLSLLRWDCSILHSCWKEAADLN